MYFFVLLNIYLCLGLVSPAPTAIYTTTDEAVDKLDNTIANINDDPNLRLSDTDTIYNDMPEETSTITPGDDLKGEETFYPVGGIWWGVRPIYGGGWWGYKPGWHGWHRPHGGGHWGGHWGGQWGGGHWSGGHWGGGHWGGGRWR